MAEPRTIDTIDRRWERRIYCVTIFPMIALMLLAFAIGRSLWESWASMAEYWRR